MSGQCLTNKGRKISLFCLTITLIISFITMSLSYYGTIDKSLLYIFAVVMAIDICLYIPLLRMEERHYSGYSNI